MQTLELPYTPFKYQVELHNDERRWKIIAGGRRVGKSKMALMEMLKHCIEVPKASAWWVAPTLATSRDVGWKEFKELSENIKPIIKSLNETRMEVTFINGSTMTFKGADNEAALRGRGLTYLIIDEAAFVDEDIWVKVLRPALTDRKGKAILISTPNGKNWFYEAYVRATRKDGVLWSAYHWATPLNPLISEAELLDAAQDMDELAFRQEFLAEFITREGMVYAEFNNDNIIDSGLPSLHSFDIYLGMDFGFANPTAICFMAIDHDNGNVTMFDELYVNRTPIDAIEYLILEKLGKWGMSAWDVKAIYCDPAGNAAELSSGISPVDYLRQSPHKWTVLSKGSEIMPGINLVRAYICNARGHRRFFVTNNCRVGIDSLSRYTYTKQNKYTDTIKEEPLKDGKWDHMCDAIRYFFVNQFDNAKYIEEKPRFINIQKPTEEDTKHWKRCATCKKMFRAATPKGQPPHFCKQCLGELDYVQSH